MSENILARNGCGDGCQIRSLDWRCHDQYNPLKTFRFLRMEAPHLQSTRAARLQWKIGLTLGKDSLALECHERSVTAFRANEAAGPVLEFERVERIFNLDAKTHRPQDTSASGHIGPEHRHEDQSRGA
jgi:hypothetical protein